MCLILSKPEVTKSREPANLCFAAGKVFGKILLYLFYHVLCVWHLATNAVYGVFFVPSGEFLYLHVACAACRGGQRWRNLSCIFCCVILSDVFYFGRARAQRVLAFVALPRFIPLCF